MVKNENTKTDISALKSVSDFPLDCKYEIQILKATSRSPNRTHPTSDFRATLARQLIQTAHRVSSLSQDGQKFDRLCRTERFCRTKLSFYKLSKNLQHRKLSYFIRAIYHTFTTLSITHLGCWENTRRFSRVLPTSRVGYHAGKPIHRKCGLLLKCQIPRETVTSNFPRVLMFPETNSRKTKLSGFPRDLTLSVLLYFQTFTSTATKE